MNVRKLVGHIVVIHLFALLGLFALWGAVAGASRLLLLPMALSFMGAVCGAFVRVIDAIR